MRYSEHVELLKQIISSTHRYYNPYKPETVYVNPDALNLHYVFINAMASDIFNLISGCGRHNATTANLGLMHIKCGSEKLIAAVGKRHPG